MSNRTGRCLRSLAVTAAVFASSSVYSGSVAAADAATRPVASRPPDVTITGKITDGRCLVRGGSVIVNGSFRFNVDVVDTNPNARYTLHYRLVFFKRDLNGAWQHDFTHMYDTHPWPYEKIDGVWEDGQRLTVTPVTWTKSRLRLRVWVERTTASGTRTVARLNRGVTAPCRPTSS